MPGKEIDVQRTLAPGEPRPSRLRLPRWSEAGGLPPCDYHMHTTYTDGTHSVAEMVAAAGEAALREIMISDHVRHTSTYYPEALAEIRALASGDLLVLSGVEAKVLDLDGTLDVAPEVAESCDGLIGSVHGALADSTGEVPRWRALTLEAARDVEFRLAMAIVTGSRAHVLGHPMGMTIRYFRAYFRAEPVEELRILARACAAHGKAFELSAAYGLDPALMAEIVAEADCPVSIASDAHSRERVGEAWRLFEPLMGSPR
jgi:histidinol phosphatase-like PHP family hydrolase